MKTAAAFLGMWLVATSPAFACAVYTCDDPRSEGYAERQQQQATEPENPCRPEQTFRKGICWDTVIIPPPSGAAIPSQFHGEWCWHHYRGQGKDKYTFGRQAPLIGCYEMSVAKYALVIHDPLGMLHCTPLEITYQSIIVIGFKGECTFFQGPTLGKDQRTNIIEGTAWIENDDLLIDVRNVPPPTTAGERDFKRENIEAIQEFKEMLRGHLEKFLSPSRHESDSVTARGYGMERAGHGAEGLFRC